MNLKFTNLTRKCITHQRDRWFNNLDLPLVADIINFELILTNHLGEKKLVIALLSILMYNLVGSTIYFDMDILGQVNMKLKKVKIK